MNKTNRVSTFMRKIKSNEEIISYEKAFIDETKPYFLNDYIFDISTIKVISLNVTGSNCYVISIKGKKDSKYENNSFIIKYIPIGNNELSKIQSKNECLIYSYIKKLITNNVTPFIFYGYLCKDITNIKPDIYEKIDDENFIIKNLKTEKAFNKCTKIVVLDTDDVKSTLFEFLKSSEYTYNIMLIFLFQIFYTLKVFDLIGLKHNDLHFKNILVINQKFTDSTVNKFIIDKKEYLIPNIQYSIRIFDFDLSEKFPRNNLKQEFQNIKNFKHIEYSKYYPDTKLNNIDNIIFDVLKVLYKINELQNTDLNKLIQKFQKYSFVTFNAFTLLYKHFIDTFGNFSETIDVNNKILSLDKIIEIIYNEINLHFPHNINIKETYSTNNLYNNSDNNSDNSDNVVINSNFFNNKPLPNVGGYSSNYRKLNKKLNRKLNTKIKYKLKSKLKSNPKSNYSRKLCKSKQKIY